MTKNTNSDFQDHFSMPKVELNCLKIYIFKNIASGGTNLVLTSFAYTQSISKPLYFLEMDPIFVNSRFQKTTTKIGQLSS